MIRFNASRSCTSCELRFNGVLLLACGALAGSALTDLRRGCLRGLPDTPTFLNDATKVSRAGSAIDNFAITLNC